MTGDAALGRIDRRRRCRRCREERSRRKVEGGGMYEQKNVKTEKNVSVTAATTTQEISLRSICLSLAPTLFALHTCATER